MLDYGNDLKAATTDALKKCASELGIASDIYGANEFKEIAETDMSYKPAFKGKEGKTKLAELKSMLAGDNDDEKLADLNVRLEMTLPNFKLTEQHCSYLITNLLSNAEITPTEQ